MSSITMKLNELLAAYEEKGHNVASSLQPGLSSIELTDRTRWFPTELAPELIELYSWCNGQQKDPWDEELTFWFRDRGFSSVEIAKFEYESMMAPYGVDNDSIVDGIDLATAFPFAAFNGGWYVLPCHGHCFDISHERPVISVFQGIDIYYHSIHTMLETCIAWVSHPEYNRVDGDLPGEVEIQIWRQYNPGIFS